MSKEYGLIIPNKNKGHLIGNVVKKPSIFEEDSDSDGVPEKPTGLTKNLKRQDRIVQEKAVEEDPTVYQYDELYDDMDQKRKDSKLSRKDLDKKPKYIGRLILAADRRKRENERRIERQVQREREAEGEQYKDKESFVTSAYKKKLEELKELEEQEKREDYLESIGDVTKQGNLDGFYRHLYDQKVNKTGDENDADKTVKQEKPSDETAGTSKVHKSDSEDDKGKVEEEKQSRKSKKRQYRKREDSKSNDEDEGKELSHLPSNLDADSDFSIDSESDTEAEPKVKKEKKVADKEAADVKEETVKSVEVKEDKVEVAKEEKPVEKVIKPKIDIWKKRTVGIVYDEALQRYFERKSMRESG